MNFKITFLIFNLEIDALNNPLGYRIYVMKKMILIGVFFVGLLNPAMAQNQKELVPGYYTIVGVYAGIREAYAKKYAESLKARGIQADYGFNAGRDQYLVYVGYFSDLKSCLDDMREKRKGGTFPDAWVRVIPGIIGSTAPQLITQGEQYRALPGETTEVPKDTTNGYVDMEYWQPPFKQYDPIMLSNTEVFLSMYDEKNNRIVDGTIQVLSGDNNRLIKRVNGNEYLYLPDPKGTGKLLLLCEVFGYKKIQYELNYQNPLSDTAKQYVELLGTTFVVSFNMERAEKGQLGTLGHVYFFNASAIMTPDSKYDLNSLLLYMQENPTCKVTLHGHTNGDYHGKIKTIGPSKNFFAITSDCVTKNVRAMELSYERGAVIKEWLITQGIDANRVDVKAWGGKKPLYPPTSSDAKKNLRVEVEVIQE
jgi:outer membrane protein OmpA-like peptidoglycan-associated protein